MTTIKTQPLKWHGGKSDNTGLAQWIRSLAPPSVIEDPAAGYTHRGHAFAGGLGEFWNWPHEGISETINDLDGELVNFWNVLADPLAFHIMARYLATTPLAEPLWIRSARTWEKTATARRIAAGSTVPVDLAIAFFIRYRMSRQGLGKDYATPTTRTRRGMNEQVSAWLSAVDGLPECHQRIRRVEIRNLAAVDFLAQYDHARALFYLDPPYLHTTRHGSTANHEYRQEMTEDDHRELLARLAGLSGRFMLSGYRSDLYDEAAAAGNWTRHQRASNLHSSSKKTKATRIECLWTNY